MDHGENCIMMNFITCILHKIFFFPTGFYSPYRTFAFLNGLLDPQTFGRTPWLGDQSNTRPPNIVRVIKAKRMRWAGHVALMGEGRGVYRVLVGKPKGKRPLGRPRHRWEDNIKKDLREIGIYEANWIQLAQDRVQWPAFVNAVLNLRGP
jgi:hypothetical protein